MIRPLLQQEIPRRKQNCFAGQESFVPGMEYYSLLNEDDAGKWVRRDFCLACWEKFADQKRDASYWKSKVPEEKKHPKTHADKNERALELLVTALQDPNTDTLGEAFILALYLARNKRLALRSQDEDVMIYEVLATEELLAVPKLDLSSLQIEKIQETLSSKLK
jgi:hypothetical protein